MCTALAIYMKYIHTRKKPFDNGACKRAVGHTVPLQCAYTHQWWSLLRSWDAAVL